MCEDAYYYFVHRLLHHPKLYPYVHKLHHQYNLNVAIATEYIHPLDYAFLTFVSISIGPTLLGQKMHFYTFILYHLYRTVEGIDAHLGYEFPWSPVRIIPLVSKLSFYSSL